MLSLLFLIYFQVCWKMCCSSCGGWHQCYDLEISSCWGGGRQGENPGSTTAADWWTVWVRFTTEGGQTSLSLLRGCVSPSSTSPTGSSLAHYRHTHYRNTHYRHTTHTAPSCC